MFGIKFSESLIELLEAPRQLGRLRDSLRLLLMQLQDHAVHFEGYDRAYWIIGRAGHRGHPRAHDRVSICSERLINSDGMPYNIDVSLQ